MVQIREVNIILKSIPKTTITLTLKTLSPICGGILLKFSLIVGAALVTSLKKSLFLTVQEFIHTLGSLCFGNLHSGVDKVLRVL